MRCLGQTPRRVKRTCHVSERYQPLDKARIGAKHVNKTVTRTRHIVMLCIILQSEGDIKQVANICNTKGRPSRGGRSGRGYSWRIGIDEGGHQIEAAVEHVDGPIAKVRGVKLTRHSCDLRGPALCTRNS